MSGTRVLSLLRQRAEAAGAVLTPELAARLEAYYQLLARWNRTINLSGMDLTVPTPAALDRLLIEPLLAASHAPAGAMTIDIGSGGGSPAIPFALAGGISRLVMVESRGRKAVFLREAARETGLSDARVESARFEALATSASLVGVHDLLTIRAVRVEPATLGILQLFVKPGGQIFLFQRQTSAGQAVEPLREGPGMLADGGEFPLIIERESSLRILEKGRACEENGGA